MPFERRTARTPRLRSPISTDCVEVHESLGKASEKDCSGRTDGPGHAGSSPGRTGRASRREQGRGRRDGQGDNASAQDHPVSLTPLTTVGFRVSPLRCEAAQGERSQIWEGAARERGAQDNLPEAKHLHLERQARSTPVHLRKRALLRSTHAKSRRITRIWFLLILKSAHSLEAAAVGN